MRIKLIAFLICISSLGYSQTDNVVKLNLGALAFFKNFSLQYERVIKDNMSGALGLSFAPERTIFSAVDSKAEINLKGFAITPEFRYYFGSKGAPKGFYLAPYLRYSKYILDVAVNFDDPKLTGATITSTGTGKRSTSNLGLMMGAQWLISDKFSIDWWILGAHGGKAKTSIEIPYDMTSYSDEEIKSVEDQIAAGFEKLGQDITVKASEDKKSVITTQKGSNIGVRAGLCIGYAF